MLICPQQASKASRRIKVRKAKPINRTLFRNQGGRMAIANHGVIFNRYRQEFPSGKSDSAEPTFSHKHLRADKHMSGHSCPLPLTLILILPLILIFRALNQDRGAPFLASFARSGKQERPQQRSLTLNLTLHVWSGHSCPLPLTLILPLILIQTGKGTASAVP
jgi:hypothetical protein